MGNSLQRLTTELNRLKVLEALAQGSEYVQDMDVLCDLLKVGMIEIVALVEWLEDNALVSSDIQGDRNTVSLTRMGHDVVLGRTRFPGVRRPTPRPQ